MIWSDTTATTKSSSANALDEFDFCFALCERLRLEDKLLLQKTHTEAKRQRANVCVVCRADDESQ